MIMVCMCMSDLSVTLFKQSFPEGINGFLRAQLSRYLDT